MSTRYLGGGGGSGGYIPQLLILYSEMKLKNFPCWSLGGGVHSTTFDPVLRNEVKKISHVGLWGEGDTLTTFNPELRNERFTLISFMGFPSILSTLQPFEICIFNRK